MQPLGMSQRDRSGENLDPATVVLWLFAPEMRLCVLLFLLVPRVFLTVCLNFGLI